MKSPVQRVAAIHDLSGFGRISLNVAIPILSTMGFQACPLPTSILSTHSQYPGFSFLDLSRQMEKFIQHWKQLGLEFDAVFSGFLGSAGQIEIVIHFLEAFPAEGQLIVVDPVLGDDGKLYGPFNDDMVEEMRRLVYHADVITPNLTEAAFLLGEPATEHLALEQLKDWLQRLAGLGPHKVIITSVPDPDNARRTSVVAYNSTDHRFWRVFCDYFPTHYPGTGDTFASVVTGSLLQGDSLPIALDRAVQFISYGIRATFGYGHDPREGMLLERILSRLNNPVQISSYEIVD